MSKIVFHIITLMSIIACTDSPRYNIKVTPTVVNHATTPYTYKIINGLDKTFGYDIYKSDTLMVHQLHIPALQGNQGFKSTSDAEKVAQFVVNKMLTGEIPPSISIEELKYLKIIN